MPTSTELLFDPTDPATRRNPYPSYRRMREESPAWLSPQGIWYFTKYQDAFELFRNPALSYDATATRQYQENLSTDPDVREHQLEQTRRSRSLLDVDPPDHTRLRSLINRAFTAPVVEGSRDVVERFTKELLDELEGPKVDLVADFGSMLPITVICAMLGIPIEERHRFLVISDRVARSVDPDVPMAEKIDANQQMREYIGELIEHRRQHMGDDLMSRLIDANADGTVDDIELIINTGVLLLAGFETTTNLITNTVYRLLEFPDQLARLKADPALVRPCIEESLRYDPPSQFMRPRTIIADTVVAGAELHPGDAVVPLLAAANRDPDEFPDPEAFDIGRSPNRHLSFGVGHHLCIGSALARMEGQVAVLRLFERFPDLRLDPDEEPEYRPNVQLRGFSKLPVLLA